MNVKIESPSDRRRQTKLLEVMPRMTRCRRSHQRRRSADLIPPEGIPCPLDL